MDCSKIKVWRVHLQKFGINAKKRLPVFCLSNQSIRGLKYSKMAEALIFEVPVISLNISGQGFEAPAWSSFLLEMITSEVCKGFLTLIYTFGCTLI